MNNGEKESARFSNIGTLAFLLSVLFYLWNFTGGIIYRKKNCNESLKRMSTWFLCLYFQIGRKRESKRGNTEATNLAMINMFTERITFRQHTE